VIARAWVILFSLALGGFSVAQQQTVNKVVLQVSDGDAGKWSLALNNAHNLQEDLGADKVVIEIVAYGPGVGMLKRGSAAGERVAQALRDGIGIVACQNTMRAMQLTEADMLPGIGYVPAGVVELMYKQQHGYAYIRP
jgi:intracellular sulfur oxidation DsrE/DsrF family protein